MTLLHQERIERLRNLNSTLLAEIRGQNHVIPRVVSVVQRGELGLSKAGRPRGSFLLLGPTGVGKTETVLVVTNQLFGSEQLFRFDMSEFQTQETLGLLLGGRLGNKRISRTHVRYRLRSEHRRRQGADLVIG